MAKSIDTPLGRKTNTNTNRGPGGGLGSRVNVTPPVRTGGPRQGMRPQAVGQLTGQSIDPRAKEKLLTPAYNSGVPLGNAKALDVGAGGVGTGRTLYGQSGMNATHGPVNPGGGDGGGKDILNMYGSDKPGIKR